jgi:hypothetical protein
MPIAFLSGGDLLEADAEALVNAVDEVGVMGKGLALQFRDTFRASAREYSAACARSEVSVGKVLMTRSGQLVGTAWIIHFPTKKDWRDPSRLEWVAMVLRTLWALFGDTRFDPWRCRHWAAAWEGWGGETCDPSSSRPGTTYLKSRCSSSSRNLPRQCPHCNARPEGTPWP